TRPAARAPPGGFDKFLAGVGQAFNRPQGRCVETPGQAAFKRRFHGEEIPTYIGFKRRTPLEILALLRLLKTL
ncbi:MAG: hypothetical protein EOP94_03595, partial [Zymomonas sp.]